MQNEHLTDAGFLLAILVCISVFMIVAMYGACHGGAL